MKKLFCFVSAVVLAFNAQASDFEIEQKDVPFPHIASKHIEVLSLWSLSVDHKEWGGLSGLTFKDRDTLVAVSDESYLFQIKVDYDKQGRIQKVRSAKGVPLRDVKGLPLDEKMTQDSEGLVLSNEGELLVSFERTPRIGRYDFSGQLIGKEIKAPAKAFALPENDMLEGLEQKHDGTWVVIAEGPKGASETQFWTGDGSGQWQEHRLALYGDLRPTGLSRLPKNDELVLLERLYRFMEGNTIRLSLLDGAARKELYEFKSPFPLDNFEGVTSYLDANGETILILISDDNFNRVSQRTLFMQLRLKEN